MSDTRDEVRQRLLNMIHSAIDAGEAELNHWRHIDASAPMCLWWSGYIKACVEARQIIVRGVPWSLDDEEDEEAQP